MAKRFFLFCLSSKPATRLSSDEMDSAVAEASAAEEEEEAVGAAPRFLAMAMMRNGVKEARNGVKEARNGANEAEDDGKRRTGDHQQG